MKICITQFDTATDQNLLPLSAGLLASATRIHPAIRDRCEVAIYTRRDRPEEIVGNFGNAMLLGCSCYCWNFRHSLEVARLTKTSHPDCHVVLGGPEVPRSEDAVPEFLAAHPFIDSIAIGEGELTFSELALCLMRKEDLRSVAGIAFADHNRRAVFNTPRPRIDSLGRLPSPFLDGTFDELLTEKHRNITGALMETNRGCPFSCTFCDWGQSIKTKIRDQDLERLRREIEWIGKNRMYLLWVTDANFGLRPQDLQVAGAIASARRRFGFPRALSVSWAKNCPDRVRQIYDILHQAGVECQITLTMQSMNAPTLTAVKRSNIKLDSFKALKHSFGQQDIPTYSEYIFPLPQETYESFVDGLTQSLSRSWRDFFAVYMCRLLPNTELASPVQRRRYAFRTRICEIKIARRMTHADSVPEFEELVVGTSTMSESDWAKTFRTVFLLSALYNHRLADIALNVLHDYFSLQLRPFLEFLLDDSRDTGPVLGRIRQNLDEHVASIMASRTPMRQVPEYGAYYWEPNESTYLIARLDLPGFFSDLRRSALEYLDPGKTSESLAGLLLDLFAFQEQVVPSVDRSYPHKATFRQDWLELSRSAGETLSADPEFRCGYTFDLQQPDQTLALNDQCATGEKPAAALAGARDFAISQIKVTSVGKNSVCKVSRTAGPL
jgi:hypothetical protein